MSNNTSAREPGDSESDKKPAGPGRRVCVKFRDHIALPYSESVAEYLDEAKIGPWRELTQKFPGIQLRPLISVVKPERLRQLVDDATRRDTSYRPPDFFASFAVECPAAIAPEELAAALSSWSVVETAYSEPVAVLASVTPDANSGNQGYLNPAPAGIDALCAWTQPGGDGAGQNLVDLEEGWLLNHQDLVAHNGVLLFGPNDPWGAPHGAAVLGEICASDNTVGCVGIAPNIATLGVVSIANGGSPVNAIMAAIDHLPFGGVLLIEMQCGMSSGTSAINTPFEIVPQWFDMIRLATALGITVVEAAGNGGNDLDALGGSNTTALVFNRNDPAFKDSGAIMIGAGSSTVPHTRLALGNFGNRLDCYAWGENIYTPSASTNPNTTNLYTTSFGGTSGAAAIIAGAALVVQGIAQANLGYRFSPGQMRALLAAPANGTASAVPVNDRMGIMPDLCKIIQTDAISITPDVYLRDFVGDIGDPHTGPISGSPDIILLQAPEPSPQATFGSGPNANVVLGGIAESGQDNYVYVRMLNRGGAPANNVTATVYWSPVATLVTPSLWNLVGTTTLSVVPAGNVLTVSDAIVWPAADVPPTGHYCFVALIGNAVDPAPIPTDFFGWADFCRLISDNNNVTWHNFNVVNEEQSPVEPDDGDYAVEFLLPGADDQAWWMGLEVVAKLPAGSHAALEIPLAMLEAMRHRADCKVDVSRGVAIVPVNPYGLRSLGEILFAPKSRAKSRLLVHIPKEHRHNAHDVFVRQIFNRQEVGRVTWRFAPLARRPASKGLLQLIAGWIGRLFGVTKTR